jgi:hypothetical protein
MRRTASDGVYGVAGTDGVVAWPARGTEAGLRGSPVTGMPAQARGTCGRRETAPVLRPRDYFNAPAVSPCTTCRWKTMYAASTGSIAITSPAKRPDQSPL